MTRPLRGSLQPKYRQQGFSLLELLIYIAILTIATLIIAGTFISINRGSSQTEARSDVNGNLRFAMERISQDIRAATAIATPTTTATAFDGDGVVQSDPTSGSDTAKAIAVDTGAIYVAGYQATGAGCATGGNCWRIEKRDKTTGALVTAFDTDGIAQSDPTTSGDEAYALTADSQYLYIAGDQSSGGTGCSTGCWRIEKRDKTTGALVAAFDGDGIAQSDPTTSGEQAYAITADSQYLYIAGYQGPGGGCGVASICWRIEKRDITSGTLVTSFDADGIVHSNPSGGTDVAYAISVDSSYIYIGGSQINDGGECPGTAGFCWRIEKRDKTSGALVTAFDSDGIIIEDPALDEADEVNAITTDSQYLYIGGYQGVSVGCTGDCWRIEKRDITTGALITAFDSDGIILGDPTSGSDTAQAIAVDTGAIYVAGYQATGAGCSTGLDCWRIEKRDKTTGVLITAFNGDGAAQSDPTSGFDNAYTVTTDSQYLYVAGQQATGAGCSTGSDCWRTEKRFLSDGALATGAYGDTTSTLVMTVSGSTVTYCVANGQLRRQVTGSCTASSEPITADTVWVETPSFTRLQNTNAILGKTIVSIEMRLTAAASSTNPDAQFTSTKRTTASVR